MTLKKVLSITFIMTFLFSTVYYLFLLDLDKTYENIGISLNVPGKPIKTITLHEDEYILFYSSGSAFTSREWWVNKNGDLIYHISSQDGQIDDLTIKDGKIYLVGIGKGNVVISK